MGEANLHSDIWDKDKRDQTISNFLTRLAKGFKQKEVLAMETEAHTGVIYSRGVRGDGVGFRRYHQASSRGERPARDTGNLIDSVDDEKSAPLVHDVFVDNSSAPYGKYLQDETVLDRPVLKLEDLQDFSQNEMKDEMDRVKRELMGGI